MTLNVKSCIAMTKMSFASSTHLTRCIVVILFALTVTGCIPLPHFISLSPHVTGKVTQSGKPIVNANVFVNLGSAECKTSSSTMTKTDAQGNFVITEQSAFKFFYIPLVEPLSVNDWELCIEQNHKTSLAITSVNAQARNAKVIVFCDLDKPHEIFSSLDSGGKKIPIPSCCDLDKPNETVLLSEALSSKEIKKIPLVCNVIEESFEK
jgi:hypothetical protein